MKGILGSPKIKVVFSIVAGVLLLYSLLGFLLLPWVLSSQIPKLGQEELNRVILVDDIQFNPFSMELSIRGLEVKNLDESTFISFDQLYLNVAVLQTIVDLSLMMDQVLLKKPYVFVKRGKDGDFNFTDMLSQEAAPEEKESSDGNVFPITISQIAISEGKLSWEDSFSSQFQREDVYPLNLNIDNFTTLVNKQSRLGFSLMFASGGQFDWKGQIKLNPFESKGHIKLNKVNFQRVWQLFLQDHVEFEILKGSEVIEADYHFFSKKEEIQLFVNNAAVHLFDIQLTEKGGSEALVSVPDFKISGISVDLLNKNIEISEVSAKDASFKAWLNEDGSINYQSMFAGKVENNPEPHETQQTKDKVNKEEKQWKVRVSQLALKNFALNFIDNSLKNSAQLDLSSFDLNINNLSDDLHAKLPINLGLKINNTGTISIKGDVIPEPFSAKLQVNAANIGIKNFQSYIEQFVRLDVISGLFNVDAEISMQQAENESLAIHFLGDSQITDFISRDQRSNQDFVKWRQLNLNKMDLDMGNNNYIIESVEIDQPYARVLIRKDKTINMSDVVVDSIEQKKPEKEEKLAKQEKQVVNYKVSQIELKNGESDFTDLSLILPFSAHLNKLNGSVKGISSIPNAVAKVSLAGRVESLAPVKISGKIIPTSGDSELSLDFRSMPLPLVTPYMAEFAGRKIEKGNMSLELKYKISKNQLTASNNLLIDQLILGDEVENPEAISLPLDLAIALLEDTDGKIILDVPITGNLDEPEFSVSSIVVDALVNVITKVIASPFNAIASLISSDGDISKVLFSAGKASLSEKQRVKLDELANALSRRPGLILEIKGAAYTEKDWPELQLEALEKKLLQNKTDQLTQDSGKKILAENVKLSEDEYQQRVAELFIQQFPQLAERSLFGTPRLLDPSMGDFYEIAKAKLSATIPPNPQRLQQLASARGQEIAKHLVSKGLAVERVFLQGVEVDPENADDTIASNLNLTVH